MHAPQRWSKVPAACSTIKPSVCAVNMDVAEEKIGEIHHATRHPGEKRTLYFSKRANLAVTRWQMQAVITRYEAFQSVKW